MITGEQVKEAVKAAGITRVDHHDCSLCGYMTAYLVVGDNLYFDAGCNCSSYGRSPPRPSSWDNAANWINMQSQPEWRAKIAAAFGITVEPSP